MYHYKFLGSSASRTHRAALELRRMTQLGRGPVAASADSCRCVAISRHYSSSFAAGRSASLTNEAVLSPLLNIQGAHSWNSTGATAAAARAWRDAFRLLGPWSQKDDNSGREGGGGGDGDASTPPPPDWTSTVIIGLIVGGILLASSSRDNAEKRNISWQTFTNDLLSQGQVAYLVVDSPSELIRVVTYATPGPAPPSSYPYNVGLSPYEEKYYMKMGNINKLEEKLRKAEDELRIDPSDRISIQYKNVNVDRISSVVKVAVVILGILIVRSMLKEAMKNFSQETKAQFTLVKQKRTGVKFKDVAGLKEAKTEILEFVDYLKDPRRFRELGAKVPKGALLLGPPGCGKTLLAKAVANEASVPFINMNGPEFVEVIGGVGASRVRSLFKEARKQAPSIIYIDEIDAIGRRRSGGQGSGMPGGNDEQEQTLNQLLVEMDGMQAGRHQVIMLASTNRADVLDKALLRPGRFDRHILIDLPTLEERKELFQLHLKPLNLEQPAQRYVGRMAQLSPAMSGADIANVCNEAALYAARLDKKKVGGTDLEYAIERVVGGAAKKTGVLGKEELTTVAYHEAGHALVGWLLEHTPPLLKVSIVPRTSAALGFAQYLPKDQQLLSQEELFDRMCLALGGRAAESRVFNSITTGAEDDLKKVTQMAYNQIRCWGMSAKVGLLAFPSQEELQEMGGRRPFSGKLAHLMDEEARRLIGRAYRHTEQLIQDHRHQLDALAKELLQKEVLNYDDLVRVIGESPHGNKKVTAAFLHPDQDQDQDQDQAPPSTSQGHQLPPEP